MAAADADARAGAAEARADEEERAAFAASERARTAEEAFQQLNLLHQEHERLVLEGKAARATYEAARQQTAELESELAELDQLQARLVVAQRRAAQLAEAEELAQRLAAVQQAATDLDALPEPEEPPPPDEAGLAAAEEAAMTARSALGSAEATQRSALAQLELARSAYDKTADLSGQEDCPLCGQPLGDAFRQVQSHRADELARAEAAAGQAAASLERASVAAQEAVGQLRRLTSGVEAARRAHQEWQQANTRQADAQQRLGAALAALAEASPAGASRLGDRPSPGKLSSLLAEAQAHLAECQQAAQEAAHLRGRLERRAQAQAALEQAQARAEEAASLLEVLRSKLRGLGFDPAALEQAQASMADAQAAAQRAASAANLARQEAVRARAGAEAEAKRLADAQAQHAQLADLASQSIYLGRVAELLNAFRNDVVATVGPLLAVQAAELFAELTDNDYDRLEVDPETYGLQISDDGRSYGLERFSGSEVDLANLALRVAISEHVRLLSGGTVGLLVLDEIFGPLDEERKARMLQALERLRGRFRQVLVVTHSTDIKEQLPHAIEVVKKPGRRATARLVEV